MFLWLLVVLLCFGAIKAWDDHSFQLVFGFRWVCLGGNESVGVSRNAWECVVSCQTAANEHQDTGVGAKVFLSACCSWDELYPQYPLASMSFLHHQIMLRLWYNKSAWQYNEASATLGAGHGCTHAPCVLCVFMHTMNQPGPSAAWMPFCPVLLLQLMYWG